MDLSPTVMVCVFCNDLFSKTSIFNFRYSRKSRKIFALASVKTCQAVSACENASGITSAAIFSRASRFCLRCSFFSFSSAANCAANSAFCSGESFLMSIVVIVVVYKVLLNIDLHYFCFGIAFQLHHLQLVQNVFFLHEQCV